MHMALIGPATTVVLAAMAYSSPSSGTTMAYRWRAGQPARYKLIANLSGSLPIMQSVEPVELDAVLTIVYKVTPKSVRPDGSAVVDFRVQEADAEVAKIPIGIPFEDAKKVLDRTVTFASTGAVTKVGAAPPLPFAVTIPGLDPQRLYSLVCPVVFPETAIPVGHTWDYDGRFLGSDEAPATFRATLLTPQASATGARRSHVRVRSTFTMDVDQRLDADKKPVAEGAEVHRTRKGVITGEGLYTFDSSKGALAYGTVNMSAEIVEKVLGEPAPGEPAETASKVKAVVTVKPVAEPPAKPAAAPARRRSK